MTFYRKDDSLILQGGKTTEIIFVFAASSLLDPAPAVASAVARMKPASVPRGTETYELTGLGSELLDLVRYGDKVLAFLGDS